MERSEKCRLKNSLRKSHVMTRILLGGRSPSLCGNAVQGAFKRSSKKKKLLDKKKEGQWLGRKRDVNLGFEPERSQPVARLLTTGLLPR